MLDFMYTVGKGLLSYIGHLGTISLVIVSDGLWQGQSRTTWGIQCLLQQYPQCLLLASASLQPVPPSSQCLSPAKKFVLASLPVSGG